VVLPNYLLILQITIWQNLIGYQNSCTLIVDLFHVNYIYMIWSKDELVFVHHRFTKEIWGYVTTLFATVSFATTFAITYQLHKNLARVCDHVANKVKLLSSSSSYVNASMNIFIYE
jgi:hypothetical protein